MKIKSEWVHQPEVDQAGDAMLAEGKVTLDTITAYQVAARLDRSANPSLYAKFRDWRARRRIEAEPATVDVPPEVEANIRAIFARLTAEGVSTCLDAVRVVGGSLDRAATLRIGAAERRADKAEAETADVVAIGERMEADLRAAMVRIEELEQTLADAQRREDRLTGRLEQRAADLANALRRRKHVDTKASAPFADGERDDRAGDGAASAVAEPADHADPNGLCPMPATSPAAQLLLTFRDSRGQPEVHEDVGHD